MIVKVQNSLPQSAPFTFLSVAEAAGVSTLHLKNINSAQASWAVQLGTTGEEQSEVLVMGTAVPSGTSVTTTANTRFSHPTDTPVYFIKYNQVVFERSTAGTAGTATPMTDGTITITPDSPYTQFDDTSGSTSYAYRAYFQNSVTLGTTVESDWLTPTGFTFYSLAKIRARIKSRFHNPSFISSDEIINDWINEYLQKMQNVAIDVNKDYALGSTTVAFSGTTELGTITATDFKEIRRVWMTNDNSSFYKASKMNITDFTPQQTFAATDPKFYYKGDNVIGRLPHDSTGTASIIYYQIPSILVNDTDEIPVSMRAYTKGFIDYAQAMGYYLDNDAGRADRFLVSANQEIEKYRTEITPRSKTGPQTIVFTDVVDSDDGYGY